LQEWCCWQRWIGDAKAPTLPIAVAAAIEHASKRQLVNTAALPFYVTGA
jgi:hypothetical protein